MPLLAAERLGLSLVVVDINSSRPITSEPAESSQDKGTCLSSCFILIFGLKAAAMARSGVSAEPPRTGSVSRTTNYYEPKGGIESKTWTSERQPRSCIPVGMT